MRLPGFTAEAAMPMQKQDYRNETCERSMAQPEPLIIPQLCYPHTYPCISYPDGSVGFCCCDIHCI